MDANTASIRWYDTMRCGPWPAEYAGQGDKPKLDFLRRRIGILLKGELGWS